MPLQLSVHPPTIVELTLFDEDLLKYYPPSENINDVLLSA